MSESLSFSEIVFFLLSMIYYLIEGIFLFIKQFIWPCYRSINGEVVLITGAGSGIGRYLCLKFSTEHCTVIAVDIHQDSLKETKDFVRQKANKLIYTIVCDIRKKSNIIKLRQLIESHIGVVSIVVNNAGILNGKPILDLSDNDIREAYEVNVFAQYFIVQEFLPAMLQQSRGNIVFVSSVAGVITGARMTDYCASKSSVFVLAEAVLCDLKHLYGSDINVTVVTPFSVDTGLLGGCKSRFPIIFPVLSPSYVADKIVKAVQKNQFHLAIGRSAYFMILAKVILPTNALMEVYKFFGGISYLDDYVDCRSTFRRESYDSIQDNVFFIE